MNHTRLIPNQARAIALQPALSDTFKIYAHIGKRNRGTVINGTNDFLMIPINMYLFQIFLEAVPISMHRLIIRKKPLNILMQHTDATAIRRELK